MRSTEPGAQLREEDVGADGQQQRLLLDEAVATPIEKRKKKNVRKGELCQCVRLVGK